MKLSALAAMLAAVVLASPPVRSAGPRLVPHVRAGRHAFGGQPGQLLVVCPTPGCSTPLRPDKVASHLLKCPVLAEQRALEASGYYLRGCNTGASEVDDSADVAPLTPEVAAALEAQLRAVHEAEMGGRLVHTAAAPSPFMATASVKERERQRQRLQRSAIADQLAALGVLGQGHCIVELGAGNGELSLSIAEAYPEVRSDALVLLDARSKPKGKAGGARLAADPALRERFGSVARVKLGLEDTELRGPRPPGWEASSRPEPRRPRPRRLASSLHTCRLKPRRGVNAREGSERADAGRRAKDLLDAGRVRYLEALGFDARLVTYIDAGVTPENALIVATRPAPGGGASSDG